MGPGMGGMGPCGFPGFGGPSLPGFGRSGDPLASFDSMGRELCGDFKRGDCRRGDRCRYSHGDGVLPGAGAHMGMPPMGCPMPGQMMPPMGMPMMGPMGMMPTMP